MANPLISSTASSPEAGVLALFQPSTDGPSSGGESFSKVFEQRVREHEPSRPQSDRPAREAEGTRNAESTRSSAAGEGHARSTDTTATPSTNGTAEATGSGEEAQATPPVPDSNPPPVVSTGVAAEPGGEEPAGNPASLAAIAAIFAAMDRTIHAASGDDTDPPTDSLGRRNASLLLQSAEGSSARHNPNPGGSTALAASQTALAAKSGGGSRAESFTAGPTPLVQIQAAAVAHAARFAMPAATSMQAPMAEMPVAGLPATGLAFGIRGDAPMPPQLQLQVPAGQRMWAEDVGSRLVWMVGRGESRAELVLTPPSLGKLGVTIQINGDQTSAHFVAATSAAREALEQAMPRLREVLQQAGINLGQTNVSTSGEQQARDQASGGPGSGGERLLPLPGSVDELGSISTPNAWTRSGTGMIDTFA